MSGPSAPRLALASVTIFLGFLFLGLGVLSLAEYDYLLYTDLSQRVPVNPGNWLVAQYLLFGLGVLFAGAGTVIERVSARRDVTRGSGPRFGAAGLALLALGTVLTSATMFGVAVLVYNVYDATPLNVPGWTTALLDTLAGVGILLAATGWLMGRLRSRAVGPVG